MEKTEKRGKAKLDLEKLKEIYDTLARERATIRITPGEVTRAIRIELDEINRNLLKVLMEAEVEGKLELDEIYAENDRVIVRYEIIDDDVEIL